MTICFHIFGHSGKDVGDAAPRCTGILSHGVPDNFHLQRLLYNLNYRNSTTSYSDVVY